MLGFGITAFSLGGELLLLCKPPIRGASQWESTTQQAAGRGAALSSLAACEYRSALSLRNGVSHTTYLCGHWVL